MGSIYSSSTGKNLYRLPVNCAFFTLPFTGENIYHFTGNTVIVQNKKN